jgi:hypothetical protein
MEPMYAKGMPTKNVNKPPMIQPMKNEEIDGLRKSQSGKMEAKLMEREQSYVYSPYVATRGVLDAMQRA